MRNKYIDVRASDKGGGRCGKKTCSHKRGQTGVV